MPRDEFFKNYGISRQKSEGKGLLRLYPPQVLPFFATGFAHEFGDMKKIQPHAEAALHIFMVKAFPEHGLTHAHAQLFSQFAFEGVFRAFSGFELAAGKLPVSFKRLVAKALAGQKPLAPPDDARSYFYMLHATLHTGPRPWSSFG